MCRRNPGARTDAVLERPRTRQHGEWHDGLSVTSLLSIPLGMESLPSGRLCHESRQVNRASGKGKEGKVRNAISLGSGLCGQ